MVTWINFMWVHFTIQLNQQKLHQSFFIYLSLIINYYFIYKNIWIYNFICSNLFLISSIIWPHSVIPKPNFILYISRYTKISSIFCLCIFRVEQASKWNFSNICANKILEKKNIFKVTERYVCAIDGSHEKEKKKFNRSEERRVGKECCW